MASWFTKLVDKVTPWDRGGEVQRRQEDEERRRREAQARQQQQVSQRQASQQLQPQQQSSAYDYNPSTPSLNSSNITSLESVLGTKTPGEKQPEPKLQKAKPKEPSVWDKKSTTSKIGAAASVPLRSLFRVATGIGQGASGLVDLATPGEGTSRVTQRFNTMAEKLDADARAQGVEGAYKALNVPMEIGSYLIPGTAASKVANKIPSVAKASTALTKYGDDAVKQAQNAGKLKRYGADVIQDLLDPRNIAQEANLTGRYMGQNTAQGNETTPESVAFDALTALGGGLVGPAIRRGADALKGVNLPLRQAESGIDQTDNIISKAPQAPNKVEIAPGVKVDAPAPPVRPPVELPPVQPDLPPIRPDVPPTPQPTPTFGELYQPELLTKAPVQQQLIPDVPEQALPAQPLRQAVEEVQQNTAMLPEPEVQVPVAEKPPQIAQAEARLAEQPQTVPVDNSGKLVENPKVEEAVPEQKAVAPREGAEVSVDDPLESLKQEAKRFGYDKGYTEEGQIANTIDELMKEQNAVREVGIPLYDKYKSKLDGTKTITEMMTPTELKAYRAAEAKSEKASKLLKDYFDYKKGNNQATQPPKSTPKPATTKPIENRVAQALDPENKAVTYRNLSGEERKLYKAQKAEADKIEYNKIARREPAKSDTGIAGTGEMGKSKAKSAKGREYEKTSREADLARGESEAANLDYETFVKQVNKSDAPTLRDRSVAENMQNRFSRDDPEWRELAKIRGEVDTELGQGLATVGKTIRKTSDAKQLTDRFANKLYTNIDDDTVVPKGVFDSVAQKTEAFVKKRDELGRIQDDFLKDPSDANFNKFMQTFEDVDKADSVAKLEEYNIAKQFLSKSKSEKAQKYLDTLKKEAGVYMMDGPDAAFLSSTRTMLNNFINTLGIAGEELGLGKVGAGVANKLLKDQNVGGGSLKGWKLGKRVGLSNLKKDIGLRKQAGGNKLWNTYKNIVTTGNTLGERNISGAVFAGTYDHYAKALKKAGFNGDELNRRAIVQALTDPDNVMEAYRTPILNANALGGTTSSFRTRFESQVAHALSFGSKNKTVQAGAKLLTRATVGFPTVVWRSTVQGGKRTLLGAPSWGQAAKALKSGDRAAAATHIKNAIKEGGSGGAMGMTGAFLASQGMLSGAYPSDKDERARWEREGISENSIKIGSDWYQLPPILGSLALPFMVGANTQQAIANGEGDNAVEKATEIALGAIRTAINTSPVDSLSKPLEFWTNLEQGRDVSKYLAQTASGAVRGLTPAGSFVNQVAKMFDPTKNDLQKGDMIAQFIAKVQDGFPGLTNMLESKVVDGKEIRNPSAISRLFGATSTEQSGGVQKSQQIRQDVDDSVKKLDEYGAFSDGVRNILDDEKKALLDKAKNGEELGEKDLKDLVDGMIKGVGKDADTRFLEEEKYDDNLAVLKLKRDRLEADPTTTKDTLDAYDTQIKRGEIYKKNKTPYTLIKDYKDYSLTDWRDLEDENPKLYQALWALDEELTRAGVSRGDKDGTEQKYYSKNSKKGRGGSGGGKAPARSSESRQISSILAGSTKDNKYQAIDKPKSYIPDLQLDNKAKTDLKKSITVKKGVSYT